MDWRLPMRLTPLCSLGSIGASSPFNDEDDLARADWAADKLNLFRTKRRLLPL
ncbi:MAG: hypothetical protein LBC09_00730 [Helicobacteraceae bacterium]|nr:hypothetical protein [Helicobacteraceae bacterium]